MKLKRWLEINEITGIEFAEMVGVTDGAVSRWKMGGRIPRQDQILMIEKLTSGKVRPADFYK